MKEIWKDYKDYEGLYQASNLGRVRSLVRWVKGRNGSIRFCKGKILKPGTTKDGYLKVCLCKNNKVKTYLVHRIIAETFLPNPDNLPCVNHKDEDKTNNSVDNLEWCTASYNLNYGTRNERMSKSKINGKRSKIVIQYNLDGTFVREWPSAMECERNGFKHSLIIYCCQGKRKTHKGFKWSYSLYSESKTNSD